MYGVKPGCCEPLWISEPIHSHNTGSPIHRITLPTAITRIRKIFAMLLMRGTIVPQKLRREAAPFRYPA